MDFLIVLLLLVVVGFVVLESISLVRALRKRHADRKRRGYTALDADDKTEKGE